MEVSANLSTLDQDSMVDISSFLDYHDILRLTTSAKSFSFLADNQAVWKSQISNFIALDLVHFDEDFPSMSPKEQFKFLVGKVTRICDLLANVVRKFDPTENVKPFLQNNFMEDFKNKAQIDNIIKEEYGKIPLDHYLLYRLLNGEQLVKSKPNELALLGGFTYYNSAYQFNFLPLSKPENDPILQKYKLLTFTKDPYSGVRLFADINNCFKQGYGSIFMLSSSRQENGKRIIRGFIFKPSVMRFLEDLQYISYNQEEEILDHFDSLERPLSDVTTRGIRIRTSAIFNPWDRQHGGYLFVYQIRISPNGVQGRWKLTDRHWIIDDNGTPHEVKGPGVIGYHPEVYEGCEEFTYQSCTPMHGFQGTMKGELYFRNMDTGEEIPAIVGEMKLKLPDGCPMIDFCVEDGEARVVEN